MSEQKEVRLSAKESALLIHFSEQSLKYASTILEGIKAKVIEQMSEPVEHKGDETK